MRPDTFFEFGGYTTYVMGILIIIVVGYLYHLYQKHVVIKMYKYMVYSNVAGIWIEHYRHKFYEQEIRDFQGRKRKTDMRRFKSYKKARKYALSIQKNYTLYDRVARIYE